MTKLIFFIKLPSHFFRLKVKRSFALGLPFFILSHYLPGRLLGFYALLFAYKSCSSRIWTGLSCWEWTWWLTTALNSRGIICWGQLTPLPRQSLQLHWCSQSFRGRCSPSAALCTCRSAAASRRLMHPQQEPCSKLFQVYHCCCRWAGRQLNG